jgi:hypothetical protein
MPAPLGNKNAKKERKGVQVQVSFNSHETILFEKIFKEEFGAGSLEDPNRFKRFISHTCKGLGREYVEEETKKKLRNK